MVLHDAEAERPFSDGIDCNFPYDTPSALNLIRQGWAISLNAAFAVLEEICRPPRPAPVSKARQHVLVDEWALGPDHPLKAHVLEAARAQIEDSTFPLETVIELMTRIGAYDGQRAALCIALGAADYDCPETEEAVGTLNETIRTAWSSKGV